MTHLLSRLVLPAILLTFSLTVWAQKTDVLFLKNGDRVTGEVKSLQRGKLEFKTDSMGTVFIEWDDIEEIISNTGHAVELANGQRLYGPLAKPDIGDMVTVATEQGTVGVKSRDVVTMYPVQAGFWNRLDLSASLGFSWDKGSSVGKYNLGLDAEYRRMDSITRANLVTEITTQEGRDNSKRAGADATHLRFRLNKQFTAWFGSLERNDELGLDLRALAGAGYGWAPIRSNRNWFSIAGGLDVNREIPADGESQTNLEAVGILRYEYYRYDSPERKFSVNLGVYPGLTDWGRWRANFNSDFRLEFIEDLFWVLDFYATFDSAPISVDASKSDYGITSSVAYKF